MLSEASPELHNDPGHQDGQFDATESEPQSNAPHSDMWQQIPLSRPEDELDWQSYRQRADKINRYLSGRENATDYFDPSEAMYFFRRNRSSISKENQQQELQEIKRKYALWKEDLAIVYSSLTQLILENPDTPIDNLLEASRNMADQYQLEDQTLRSILEILMSYEEKRQTIEQLRSDQPNDSDLFEQVSGTRPEGYVEVIRGPITLHFVCFDENDYMKIVTRGEILPEYEKYHHSAGISVDYLNGIITAENSQHVESLEERENIRKHEEQHAIRMLFQPMNHRWGGWVEPIDQDSAAKQAKEFMRLAREQSDDAAQNEILAYYTDATPNTAEILLQPEDQGGLYQYWNEEYKEQVIDQAVMELGNEDFRLWATKAFDEVFVGEYQQQVQVAAKIPKQLEDAGYTRAQVTGLLINEQLKDWPKIKRRLLGEVGEQPQTALSKLRSKISRVSHKAKT